MGLDTGWFIMLKLFRSKLFRKYFIIAFSVCTLSIIATYFLHQTYLRSSYKRNPMAERISGELIYRLKGLPERQQIFLLNRIHMRGHNRRFIGRVQLVDKNGLFVFPAHKRGTKININNKKELWQKVDQDNPNSNFIFVEHKRPPRNKRMDRGIRNKTLVTLSLNLIAILSGILISLLIIFRHFKGRTKEIEKVILEIKDGKLNARMKIDSDDEFGLAMKSFNIMAEEVEYLVNRLRQTETSRRDLLNELAHDVRTPVASLKNFIDILSDNKEDLTQEDKDKILSLSSYEIKYIGKLFNDLLFLGKIEEPDYQKKDKGIYLEDLIGNISENLSQIYPAISFNININPQSNTEIFFDYTLAERLFRNILENAFSFACKEVNVNIYNANSKVVIEICDDGPGISDKMIEDYGIRKLSRKDIINTSKDRPSVGLGSVIIKRIITSYSGELDIKRVDSGTLVTVTI